MDEPVKPGDSQAAFADLVIQALPENPELRYGVRADLEGRLAAARPDHGIDTVEQATAQLRARPPGKRYRWPWLAIACGLVVVLCLATVLGEAPDALMSRRGVALGNKPEWLDIRVRRWEKKLTIPGPMTHPLLGDSGDLLEESRRNWESHLNDPALYLLYCHFLELANRDLPADFDEVWQKIDPGNALWPLLRSRFLVRHCYFLDQKAKAFVLKDPVRMAAGMAALEEASRMPRFESYRGEIYERFLRISKTPRSQGEALTLQRCLLEVTGFELVPDDLALHARDLISAGEREKLGAFFATVRRMALLYHAEGSDSREVYASPFQPQRLAEMALKEGLVDDGRKFRALRDVLSVRARSLSANPFVGIDRVELPGFYQGKSDWDSVLGRWREWPVRGQVDFLSALRLVFLAAAVLVTAIAVVVCLRLLPPGTASGECARSLSRLLDRRGWLRIILGGSLLPLTYVACLVFLLRNHELGNSDQLLQMLGLSLAYALILVLVATVMGVRREVARRLGFLGQARSREAARNDLATVVSTVASPIAVFAAWPLLWLAGSFVAGMFDRDSAMRHRLLARWTAPVILALAMGVMGAVCLLREMEQRIIAGDPLHLLQRTDLPASPMFRADLDKLRVEWGM